MADPLPLSPAMASRKAQALAFVTTYLADWQYGPSYAEIGAGLGVSRERARQLVRALVRDGKLLPPNGKRRGLRLPDTIDRAVMELRAAGWHVDGDIVAAPAVAPPSPNWPLMLIAELGQIVETGDSDDDDSGDDSTSDKNDGIEGAARRHRGGKRGRARRAA